MEIAESGDRLGMECDLTPEEVDFLDKVLACRGREATPAERGRLLSECLLDGFREYAREKGLEGPPPGSSVEFREVR